MKKTIIILALLLITPSVFAHQPRLVNEATFDNPLIVKDPEISKAYYGILEGDPEYYLIQTDKEISFYINILIPDLEDTPVVSAEFLDENLTKIHLLDGENFEWEEFYEPYGKDNYLKGPEFGEHFKSITTISPGKYYIKIFNQNNKGPYSLAIGDIESFPLSEIIKTIFILPVIKVVIFKKNYLLFIPIFALALYLAYKNKRNKYR